VNGCIAMLATNIARSRKLPTGALILATFATDSLRARLERGFGLYWQDAIE
jgi:hypothetical protein